MYIRFSDLRAKEVINMDDGERLGFVCDIVIEQSCCKITALVVPGGYRVFGMLGKQDDLIIPVDRIVKIGDDLIMVSNVRDCLPRPEPRRRK
ncbi:MAG TPA: YlmC/YmxH family sporulation protein [Firmicutes bacterium]|nr:YlmC/YmxH family sporulation protein [Bacillota bacterium]